jgi:hypothetical protein
MSAIQSNPLTAFRVPVELQKRLGQTHFNTQRDDVINDTEGLTSIYPGEFQYIPDPTQEVQLVTWEDDDSQKALSLYLKMTGRDGYQPCLAKDWKVATRLETTWKPDAGGRLTLSGKSKNTLVLMWRTGESYDAAREQRLRWSNDVAKSAEEKQAELQDQLESLGASVKVTLRDDNGEADDRDDLPSKPGRKRR